MRMLRTLFSGFDAWLFGAAVALSLLGLVTMFSYVGENNFFERQIIWLILGALAFIIGSIPDYRFLRTGNGAFYLYVFIALLLILVLLIGEITKGAQSRFDLGLFSFQPSDLAKLALIILLAKYFSKRHMEIANIKHIFVSGAYALLLVGLIFIQPDFGSAIILAFIWFGIVLVAGISWKHLLLVGIIGIVAFGGLWSFGFQEYQKDRIRTFLHPLADVQDTGYNAYQSTIAVGSGQLLGKGVGYGTQSKLQFLPEYETDFVFAAFAEEWGFVGTIVVFGIFGIIIWRILARALTGETNFERLFGSGLAIFIISHFFVHIGMNIGLLPVTGTTVPFLSYGGSHLITEFLALGMLVGMTKHRRHITVSDRL